MKLDWPLMDDNITDEDLEELITFLKGSPRLTHGENVRAFEQEWSQWIGLRHSVFVNSGSSANLLTMAALREAYGPGEIIVPTLGWVSDVASVLQCGFTPVHVDINPYTLGMDTGQVIDKITSKTKAVFLTHILGYNALDRRLLDELDARSVPLVEDTCESYGATFMGRKVGSFGLMSNFSFYYGHHLTTIEGGMISTDDGNLYESLRMMRSHGLVRESSREELKDRYATEFPDLTPDFIFAFPAYNMRSTEVNAVIGRSQLKRLDQNNAIRTENLHLFMENLDQKKYRTDFEMEGSCSYALTLVLKRPDPILRDKVVNALEKANVEFRRGLSGGGNQLCQPYLRRIVGDHEWEKYPNVNHVHFYGFYIGNYPTLEKSKINRLCRMLNDL